MQRHAFQIGFVAVTAGVVLATAVPASFAQESRSAAAVKEFVSLAGTEMRYVAARLPDSKDEYVASLHIPGVQLLVIWARYKEPSLLNDMLAKHDYQGVYTDLNSASYSLPETKVFVEDLRADGLFPTRADENSPFDMYEAGGKRWMFNGDWKAQKVATEKEYLDMFAAADGRYARAIALLTAQLKKGS